MSSAEMEHMMMMKGPPYPPTTAAVGGMPTVLPDIPILAVLIALYAGSAVGNMTIFQLNNRKGHKFLPNGALFGFSMARIVTCALRIGLATHPHNVSLAIAASIFLAAGILIVYVVNLLFAQRILRARQPALGWHPAMKAFFTVLYALVAVFLILLITFIVYSRYTTHSHWEAVTRNIQLGAATYFVIITALPLIILAVSFSLPLSPSAETFGQGSMASKAIILAIVSTLCLLSAGFKAGATWEAPRPRDDPAWYQSKACLYVFYFALEIIILYVYLAARIHERFHVPNGSSKVKSYAAEAHRRRPDTAASDSEDGTADAEKELDAHDKA